MIVKKPIYRTTGLSVKNNYSKVLKILEERNRTDNLLLSEYMNKWAKKNEVAPYTYQGYMQIINGCMNKAVRKDLIERDLLDKVDRPRRAKIHPSFYSPQEAMRMLAYAKFDSCYIPILFGIYYGMRRSEAVGMQWSSIDF